MDLALLLIFIMIVLLHYAIPVIYGRRYESHCTCRRGSGARTGEWQPLGSMISKEILRGFLEVQEPTFLSIAVWYLYHPSIEDATTWSYT